MSIRLQAVLLTVLTLLPSATASAQARRTETTAPTSQSSAAVSAVPRAESRPSRARAAFPTTLPEVAARITADCQPQLEAVAEASSPLERARATLAAARCILVTQCAAPLSMELSGHEDARGKLAEQAGGALELLDQASAWLSSHTGAFEPKTVREWEDRIEMLGSFGEMFAALGEATASGASKQRLINACNGLALYLDAANEGVVESAALWQGVAYRRAGRPERALQVLRPAIAAPSSRRVGLLARLERCRALADAGRHVAALALCLRLGARVDGWFAEEDPQTRRQAADTVRWVRVTLLRGWASKLRDTGLADRADAVEAEAKKLLGSDPFPPPADRWLGLVETIPGLPDWEEAALSTSTRPAGDHPPVEPGATRRVDASPS